MTYCNLELEALDEVVPQIQSLGASLIVVTPQLESFRKQMRQRLKLHFDILSDRGNGLASQFGLMFSLPQDLQEVYRKLGADLARFNGDSS